MSDHQLQRHGIDFLGSGAKPPLFRARLFKGRSDITLIRHSEAKIAGIAERGEHLTQLMRHTNDRAGMSTTRRKATGGKL